jgi:NADPH-dependent FMN reductase
MNTPGNSIKNVAVVVGSLRRESINRKFAESVGKVAADRLRFHFIEIGDLPLYNDDLWESPPRWPCQCSCSGVSVSLCTSTITGWPSLKRNKGPGN